MAATTLKGVQRAKANGVHVKEGKSVRDNDGQGTGWMCRTCLDHAQPPTYVAFTPKSEALTHNLTRALLGLEHDKTRGINNTIPRYIDLREAPGAQPQDAVVGVCARGDACPGHRLPLDSAAHALTCCVHSGALLGESNGQSSAARRAAGAITGVATPDRWRCQRVCRGPFAPRPGDPSRTIFGVFKDVASAKAEERVREALGMTTSKSVRARWVDLHVGTQPDGSRCVVGVCHAVNTPRECPGHSLALHNVTDATACCLGCGVAVASTSDAVKRAKANGSEVKQVYA